MADDVDVASERQQALDRLAIAAVSAEAKHIIAGHEGVCDKCGNHSPRLMDETFFEARRLFHVADSIIEGICPPCRDRFKLP
jgi:hypothetical protein